MNKHNKIIYGLLFFIVIIRLFAMATLPLTDTTEARYAHTAYLMATSGDWITPYFDLTVPFWGKPPFSFWMQATSYKIFGFHDLSPRVPALLFTLMTMLLIIKYLQTFYTQRTALWGALVYFTFLLTYTLSGAVLTDPYLVFSTSLSMLSFFMIIKGREDYWQYLFFIGLSIGLLAKGPLAPVLTGGAIALWILFDFKQRFLQLKKIYWVRGILLTLLLVLPWYIMAEIKTPGFLNYFIIGEHFKRFVDSGWSGDLYGASHKKPHGIIWLMWIQASFPWVLIVFAMLYKHIRIHNSFSKFLHFQKENSEISYLLTWSTFTMIFFSLAGNTLWTYVFPALPSLAILIALYLEKKDFVLTYKHKNILFFFSVTTPLLFLIANIYLLAVPRVLPTEKSLISHYHDLADKEDKLYFIYDRSFSAQYYSKDKAILVKAPYNTRKFFSNSMSKNTFQELLNDDKVNFVAIPKAKQNSIIPQIQKAMKKVFESKKYTLYKL